VTLRIFSLPEVPRGAAGRDYVRQHQEDIAALYRDGVDGLIVTGTEPKTERFEDEPYWPALARLIDWAEDNTASAIWSCLASHAAAYRLDGIAREPLDRKMFGVFDCQKTEEHPLVSGLECWKTPHSRLNGVAEAALDANGYRILSRSATAGVDMFVKQRNSLFVFLQGHPEYDATALFGEYRRDVRRFLSAESECYPELPQGCFDHDATAQLQAFRERATLRREPGALEQFPAAEVGRRLDAPWRATAARIYGNWLDHLHALRSPAPAALPSGRRPVAHPA
jgi:homoserine O-succinyltransferase